jgi:hypothetical protein
MRSKRSWAWAGLGASSLLAFLTACGSVSEDFKIIVVTPDAGQDAAPSEDATVADAATDAASDATSDATIPDGSVQDAQVDAGVDAGSGPVVPDGGSIVIVGDAAVVIPPLDPTLLGGADGGIVISDGGLANADGGALTPRQFRDLVNGITCQRISECCCPGCTTAEQAQTVSRTKCETGLGSAGLQFITFGNETIPTQNLVTNGARLASCLSLLNSTMLRCATLQAADILTLRRVCLDGYGSTVALGGICANNNDCEMPAFCATQDAGKACVPLRGVGESCTASQQCSARAFRGEPPFACRAAPNDAGLQCLPYIASGATCSFDFECGTGLCAADSNGVKRCNDTLPFASQSDPSSYCTTFRP